MLLFKVEYGEENIINWPQNNRLIANGRVQLNGNLNLSYPNSSGQ